MTFDLLCLLTLCVGPERLAVLAVGLFLLAAANHSVVRASKVLHFVKPAIYLIWDRCGYRFYSRTLEGNPAADHFDQVNDTAAYADYAQVCQLALYAGLNVVQRQTGLSALASRISRRGNVRLRTALYLPAVSSLRYDPQQKAFYARYAG